MINSTSPQHFDESRNATRVANGRNFICSRLGNAQIICFGSNIMNQLGDRAAGATYTLAQPKGLGPARDVDAGGFFACALVDTGDVFCWGLLPSSEEISPDGADPQAVSGLAGVTALAVGFETACALQNDNRLLCWGNNETGQLGNGLTGGYAIAPVEVVGLPGGDAALLHAARARGLQEIGKTQAALAEADMAIALRPDRVALLLLRAAILRDLGQIDRAIDDLEKALAAEPENAEALHEYGALLFGQGRTDAAISAYERAIAANQNDALAYVELGRIMLSVGEREQAEKNFNTAKSIKPDIALDYSSRGFEATLNENYDAAIANYDVAILLDSENESFYADRADAYEAMGDKDKAEADRKRKALLEHASAEFDRLTEEGWSLYEADEFAKAIDVYTQALTIRPLDDVALWQRSLAYDGMENYERAIADLDKAISINPEDADYYQYRANSYAALGQVDKALADYDMSLSLERDA
jgi:tetratricopeptide (TPR) repeat protein